LIACHNPGLFVVYGVVVQSNQEMDMKARIEFHQANPKVAQLLLAIEGYLHGSGLASRLQHLIKTRASQINGCAQCIDMHTKDARTEGESEQRLYALNAWRETPFFDERERAALAWTEAVTRVADTHVPDDVYELARQQFSEQELIDLTLAIANINAWNRLSIAFRTVPGSYRPGMYKAAS
jgi:AhpD family alkylhydroperoxidase